MIRKITRIGTSHIRTFTSIRRCSIIRQQRLTTLNSVNQAKDFLPEKDKIADAFGKGPTSTFFLGGLGIKESETEITVSTPSPVPTK